MAVRVSTGTFPSLAVSASCAAFLAFGAAASTPLGGGYQRDLVCTPAGSPYVLASDVVVFPGYKLTIQPGVKILAAAGTSLIIRGEVEALGTASDTITFAAEESAAPAGAWQGIQIANNQGGKGSFRYVRISQAAEALGVECCGGPPPLSVTHGRFDRNVAVSASYSGSAVPYDSCLFEDNDRVFSAGDKRVSHSLFRRNNYGLYQTERVSVHKSTFLDHRKVALWGGRGTVDSSEVQGSPVAVRAFFEGFTLRANTFSGNDTGLVLPGEGSAEIRSNRIDSRLLNAVHTGPQALDLTRNWWGTSRADSIRERIWDARDEAGLGLVAFSPYWVDSRGDSLSSDTSGMSVDTGRTLSGSIPGNRRLAKAGSPYTLVGTATLFPQCTLTVEPGVKVLAKAGAALIIRGLIRAEGARSDSITFAAEDTAAGWGHWEGIRIANNQGGKGSFRYVRISQAAEALGVECCGGPPPLSVTHGRFDRNVAVSASYSGSAVPYDSCLFEDNDRVFSAGDKRVSHSLFRRNNYGLYQTERVSVHKSTFLDHRKVALWGGRGTVEGSRIQGSPVGIRSSYEGFTVRNSRIVDNDTGIILSQYGNVSGAVSDNNIVNRSMNVVNTGPYNVEITFNWWGTRDTAAILAKIHDGFDDPRLGLVYQPYYTDSLGKDAGIHVVVPGEPVADSLHGVGIDLETTDPPTGRIVISAGEHDIAGLGGVKSVDIALSSDLAGKLTQADLTLSYADLGLDASEASSLQIFQLDGGTWKKVGGEVDKATQTVRVAVTHFSTYGLFKAAPPTALPTPDGMRPLLTFGHDRRALTLNLGLPTGTPVEYLALDLAGKAWARGTGRVQAGRMRLRMPASPGNFLLRAQAGNRVWTWKVVPGRVPAYPVRSQRTYPSRSAARPH